MRVFRVVLRIGVLLCLAVAAVTLVALSGEYPGQTPAGLRVAVTEPLPLALVAWLNVAALHAGGARWLRVAAVVADVALFASTVPYARPGAPPLSLALPAVAALMAIGAAGVVWAGGAERTRGVAR